MKNESMMKNLGITKQELYNIWNTYSELVSKKETSKDTAIEILLSSGIMRREHSIFFSSVGLEVFTEKIALEFDRGRK